MEGKKTQKNKFRRPGRSKKKNEGVSNKNMK